MCSHRPPGWAGAHGGTLLLDSPELLSTGDLQTISLGATAQDSDGLISQVSFYANGELLGVDTTFPYGASLEVNASGVYQIYAIASDDDGNDIVSTVHRLTVVEPSEPVRELEIRADSTNIGADATISATYKSPSGTYDSSLRALVYVDGDYVGDAILSSYVAPLPWEEDPGQSLTYELPARIAGSVDVEMVIIMVMKQPVLPPASPWKKVHLLMT